MAAATQSVRWGGRRLLLLFVLPFFIPIPLFPSKLPVAPLRGRLRRRCHATSRKAAPGTAATADPPTCKRGDVTRLFFTDALAAFARNVYKRTRWLFLIVSGAGEALGGISQPACSIPPPSLATFRLGRTFTSPPVCMGETILPGSQVACIAILCFGIIFFSFVCVCV